MSTNQDTQDKGKAEEPVVEEQPIRTRVSAAMVKEDALAIIIEAGDKGITLKDLGEALQAKGHYEGVDAKGVYRKLHNVTHHLEGRPTTPNGRTFKATPKWAERVDGKATYRATDEGREYMASKG